MTVSDSIRAGLQELARLAEQVARERAEDGDR